MEKSDCKSDFSRYTSTLIVMGSGDRFIVIEEKSLHFSHLLSDSSVLLSHPSVLLSHPSHGTSHPSVLLSRGKVKMGSFFLLPAWWVVIPGASIGRIGPRFLPSGGSSVRTNHRAKRMSHSSHGSKLPAVRTNQPAGGMDDSAVLLSDPSHGTSHRSVLPGHSSHGTSHRSVLLSRSSHRTSRSAVLLSRREVRMSRGKVSLWAADCYCCQHCKEVENMPDLC